METPTGKKQLVYCLVKSEDNFLALAIGIFLAPELYPVRAPTNNVGIQATLQKGSNNFSIRKVFLS